MTAQVHFINSQSPARAIQRLRVVGFHARPPRHDRRVDVRADAAALGWVGTTTGAWTPLVAAVRMQPWLA
jgi:hypothetical protein